MSGADPKTEGMIRKILHQWSAFNQQRPADKTKGKPKRPRRD